jgi:hypothetical protein
MPENDIDGMWRRSSPMTPIWQSPGAAAAEHQPDPRRPVVLNAGGFVVAVASGYDTARRSIG